MDSFIQQKRDSVAGICTQFSQSDWNHGISRRSIFDVASLRYPVHVKPLLRLLRAMTGVGFLDTDPMSMCKAMAYRCRYICAVASSIATSLNFPCIPKLYPAAPALALMLYMRGSRRDTVGMPVLAQSKADKASRGFDPSPKDSWTTVEQRWS